MSHSRSITFADQLSRGARDEFLHRAKLFGFDMEEQRKVDYYDHLRIMHGPLRLPAWLDELDTVLACNTIPDSLAPELLKLFTSGAHAV